MNKKEMDIIEGHKADAKRAVKCENCDRSVFPEDLKFHKKHTCPEKELKGNKNAKPIKTETH